MTEYQSEPTNIKLKAKERDDIARRIRDMIDAADGQKGSAPNGWWRSVYDKYLGVAPDQDESSTIAQFMLPHTIRPRSDALNAQICTVIGRQDPYMTAAEGVPAEVARRKERALHRMWQDAKFDVAIRKAGIPAILLNKAIYRVYPEYGDYNARVGCCIEVIHPKNFFCYPASLNGKEDWSLACHRQWKRIRTIKDKMRAGSYFDITGKMNKPLVESDPSQYDETGEIEHSNTAIANHSPENDSKPVRIDVGQVKLDLSPPNADGERTGEEKWYRFELAYDSVELLSLSPYGFTQCEYFFGSLLPELEMFWGGNALGRAAYPIQDAADKNWSTYHTMGHNAAKRLIVGPGGIDGSTHVTADWGEYYGNDDIQQPMSFPITPQLAPLLDGLDRLERMADQNFRISQNTLGTIQGKKTTATTDSIVAAGVQVGVEEFIANFSEPFPAMAQHTEEIALHLFADLVSYYGEESFPATPEDLAMRTTWETTGKSPNATPEAKIQHGLMLSEVAADPEYGIDKYKLGSVLTREGPLAGVEGIQKTLEQMQQEAEAIAQAEQEAQQEMMAAQGQQAEQEQMAKANESEDKLVHGVVGELVKAATRPAPQKPTNGKAAGVRKKRP